ncbi:rhodanese-like domain-containing protein [Ferruginibacter yonginensis]|uniref:Rhodanese-like domain-containing protein n=1 Tax=Ferruginibacter yonginensis TaxID=1310416 RepID=A0ABV8QUI7_9BACT
MQIKKRSYFLVKIASVLLITGFIYFSTMAQMVKSKMYNAVLHTLLSHKVKEVGVLQIDTSNTNIVYLDAREKNEFEVSHIKNATWVGYNDFSLSRVASFKKDTPIIVYCSVGYRSEKITQQLLNNGFTNVSNLYGGIFEWKNTNHTVVDVTGAATNKVHAYSKTWGIWLKKGEKVY